MTREQAILVTLLVYKASLIGIGLWASRRTHDDRDFFLGGRQLGPWVAAISASASSSSAWTLLGVSGAAYAWGISALWLFPATLLGFVVNWYWVAPRLMRMSRADDSLTLTAFLAGDRHDPLYPAVMKFASIAIIFSFMFYVASQFQAAGHAFATSFGLSANAAILIGAAIIVVYTLLGGFWAVSVTDLIQGLLMVLAAVLLPTAALIATGGPAALVEGLREVSTAGQLRVTGSFTGVMALFFVLGTLGIGLGYPGQPHVVNRFMALRNEASLLRGRTIAITWAVLIYTGMLLLGLCARVLFRDAPDGEQIFFVTANGILPPVVAGIMVAAVLSAIMSTADSQLLVASSSVALDWKGAGHEREAATHSLTATRISVVAVSILAVVLAIFAPSAIFSRVLFAWSALGSAFAPALVVRLAGYRITTARVLASMIAGFGLTIVMYLLPDAPGDAAERLLPVAAALAIAWPWGPSRSAMDFRERR